MMYLLTFEPFTGDETMARAGKVTPTRRVVDVGGTQVECLAIPDTRGDVVRLALVTRWTGHITNPEHAVTVADDAVVLGPVTPLGLAAARTSALAEIRTLAEARIEGDVQVPGYPPLGVGREARDRWAALLGAVTACEALGVDPDLAVFPAPFSSRDGQGITLRSKAEARGLYLMLFSAGAALERAGDAAVVAVSQAATVEEIAAALDTYRSAK